MTLQAVEHQDREELFIDGAWAAASTQERTEVVDCYTEQPLGSVPAATPADVDAAVAAAARALPGWSASPPAVRAGHLRAIADALEARREELMATVSREVGTTREIAELVQTGVPLGVLRSMADIAERFEFEERIGPSLVQLTPVGVVASITPWNYPLHQLVSKVAPALATGCTIVAKPAELAPLTVFAFAECAAEAGLPPGVFNVVSGRGTVVGEALAAHPDVAKVTFTGSTRAGKRVAQLASETVKRITLELGGKSANVLLDDLGDDELERAVRAGVVNCYRNTGQTCTAQSRMLVPAARQDAAVEIAAAAVEELTLGDPLAADTTLGPVVSAAQRDGIRSHIDTGKREGAQLVAGGSEPPELPHGYFVSPTVFARASTDMTIAQEEIFGPVLTMIPYDSEDDAVRIANDSPYGLSGAVWSADPERALRVASRMETGQVMLNGSALNPDAPFGGFKQSGLGRELGEYGFREFLEPRSIQLPPRA